MVELKRLVETRVGFTLMATFMRENESSHLVVFNVLEMLVGCLSESEWVETCWSLVLFVVSRRLEERVSSLGECA
jgi:hypothetical protein